MKKEYGYSAESFDKALSNLRKKYTTDKATTQAAYKHIINPLQEMSELNTDKMISDIALSFEDLGVSGVLNRQEQAEYIKNLVPSFKLLGLSTKDEDVLKTAKNTVIKASNLDVDVRDIVTEMVNNKQEQASNMMKLIRTNTKDFDIDFAINNRNIGVVDTMSQILRKEQESLTQSINQQKLKDKQKITSVLNPDESDIGVAYKARQYSKTFGDGSWDYSGTFKFNNRDISYTGDDVVELNAPYAKYGVIDRTTGETIPFFNQGEDGSHFRSVKELSSRKLTPDTFDIPSQIQYTKFKIGADESSRKSTLYNSSRINWRTSSAFSAVSSNPFLSNGIGEGYSPLGLSDSMFRLGELGASARKQETMFRVMDFETSTLPNFLTKDNKHLFRPIEFAIGSYGLSVDDAGKQVISSVGKKTQLFAASNQSGVDSLLSYLTENKKAFLKADAATLLDKENPMLGVLQNYAKYNLDLRTTTNAYGKISAVNTTDMAMKELMDMKTENVISSFKPVSYTDPVTKKEINNLIYTSDNKLTKGVNISFQDYKNTLYKRGVDVARYLDVDFKRGADGNYLIGADGGYQISRKRHPLLNETKERIERLMPSKNIRPYEVFMSEMGGLITEDSSYILGHNLGGAEIRFIQEFADMPNKEAVLNHLFDVGVDTFQIARAIVPGARSKSLNSLAEAFGTDVESIEKMDGGLYNDISDTAHIAVRDINRNAAIIPDMLNREVIDGKSVLDYYFIEPGTINEGDIFFKSSLRAGASKDAASEFFNLPKGAYMIQKLEDYENGGANLKLIQIDIANDYTNGTSKGSFGKVFDLDLANKDQFASELSARGRILGTAPIGADIFNDDNYNGIANAITEAYNNMSHGDMPRTLDNIGRSGYDTLSLYLQQADQQGRYETNIKAMHDVLQGEPTSVKDILIKRGESFKQGADTVKDDFMALAIGNLSKVDGPDYMSNMTRNLDNQSSMYLEQKNVILNLMFGDNAARDKMTQEGEALFEFMRKTKALEDMSRINHQQATLMNQRFLSLYDILKYQERTKEIDGVFGLNILAGEETLNYKLSLNTTTPAEASNSIQNVASRIRSKINIDEIDELLNKPRETIFQAEKFAFLRNRGVNMGNVKLTDDLDELLRRMKVNASKSTNKELIYTINEVVLPQAARHLKENGVNLPSNLAEIINRAANGDDRIVGNAARGIEANLYSPMGLFVEFITADKAAQNALSKHRLNVTDYTRHFANDSENLKALIVGADDIINESIKDIVTPKDGVIDSAELNRRINDFTNDMDLGIKLRKNSEQVMRDYLVSAGDENAASNMISGFLPYLNGDKVLTAKNAELIAENMRFDPDINARIAKDQVVFAGTPNKLLEGANAEYMFASDIINEINNRGFVTNVMGNDIDHSHGLFANRDSEFLKDFSDTVYNRTTRKHDIDYYKQFPELESLLESYLFKNRNVASNDLLKESNKRIIEAARNIGNISQANAIQNKNIRTALYQNLLERATSLNGYNNYNPLEHIAAKRYNDINGINATISAQSMLKDWQEQMFSTQYPGITPELDKSISARRVMAMKELRWVKEQDGGYKYVFDNANYEKSTAGTKSMIADMGNIKLTGKTYANNMPLAGRPVNTLLESEITHLLNEGYLNATDKSILSLYQKTKNKYLEGVIKSNAPVVSFDNGVKEAFDAYIDGVTQRPSSLFRTGEGTLNAHIQKAINEVPVLNNSELPTLGNAMTQAIDDITGTSTASEIKQAADEALSNIHQRTNEIKQTVNNVINHPNTKLIAGGAGALALAGLLLVPNTANANRHSPESVKRKDEAPLADGTYQDRYNGTPHDTISPQRTVRMEENGHGMNVSIKARSKHISNRSDIDSMMSGAFDGNARTNININHTDDRASMNKDYVSGLFSKAIAGN